MATIGVLRSYPCQKSKKLLKCGSGIGLVCQTAIRLKISFLPFPVIDVDFCDGAPPFNRNELTVECVVCMWMLQLLVCIAPLFSKALFCFSISPGHGGFRDRGRGYGGGRSWS